MSAVPFKRFTHQPAPRGRPVPHTAGLSASASGNPPPLSGAGAVIGVDPGGGDDHCAVSLVMSGRVVLCLRLSALEAGLSEEQLLAKLIAEHAERIGIARLARAEQTHNRSAREGREDVPSGVLPPPRAPP